MGVSLFRGPFPPKTSKSSYWFPFKATQARVPSPLRGHARALGLARRISSGARRPHRLQIHLGSITSDLPQAGPRKLPWLSFGDVSGMPGTWTKPGIGINRLRGGIRSIHSGLKRRFGVKHRAQLAKGTGAWVCLCSRVTG